MSPQRMDSNFEGMNALPVTMRGPSDPRGAPAHPQMTNGEDVRECRAILGNKTRDEGWLIPSWELQGWFYDEVLRCRRWRSHLLSDEEREQVRRAREACAPEEARTWAWTPFRL